MRFFKAWQTTSPANRRDTHTEHVNRQPTGWCPTVGSCVKLSPAALALIAPFAMLTLTAVQPASAQGTLQVSNVPLPAVSAQPRLLFGPGDVTALKARRQDPDYQPY